MRFNITTPDHSPLSLQGGLHVFYILIPFVAFTFIGCTVAWTVYLRRKMRLDELRHRLVPVYRYDPSEEDPDWEENWDGEEDLMKPLYRAGKLSFTPGY